MSKSQAKTLAGRSADPLHKDAIAVTLWANGQIQGPAAPIGTPRWAHEHGRECAWLAIRELGGAEAVRNAYMGKGLKAHRELASMALAKRSDGVTLDLAINWFAGVSREIARVLEGGLAI